MLIRKKETKKNRFTALLEHVKDCETGKKWVEWATSVAYNVKTGITVGKIYFSYKLTAQRFYADASE